MKSAILSLLILSMLTISCSKKDEEPMSKDPIPKSCEMNATESTSLYDSAPRDPLTIRVAAVDGDCLQLEFWASGCSGDSWEYLLIDPGSVAESSPPQRNIRLSLKNEEACLAVITKNVSFDLSELQVIGSSAVLFNLEGYNDQIRYAY